MAEEPKRRGVTLYEVAGWMQAALALPFRAVGWALRKDIAPPSIPTWALIAPRGRWIIVIVLGGVAGSTVLFALWLWFHVLMVAVGWTPSPNAWDDIRFGLLIVAGVLSAPFVVWRTMIADRQTDINQQTHFTDLYTKAVEMLGADKTVKKRVEKPRALGAAPVWEDVETTEPNIEVRLGAIYALQRIMNQSDADYLPILRTLCAYVRENATFQERPSFSEGAPLPEPPEPPKGRDETPEELAERLEAIRIHAQNLQSWGERLRAKAASRGVASAQRPDIRAALDVLCDRDEARRLKLEGLERVEPPAFDSSDWPDYMSSEGVQARRDRIAAWSVEIDAWASKGARLDLAGAVMQGMVRSNADLRRADLTGAQVQGAVLHGAWLQGAVLYRAQMQGVDLRAAWMQGADLAHAHLQVADCWQAQMQGDELTLAQMQATNLRQADMQGADLRRAILTSADVWGANLAGANLVGADFSGAMHLTYNQLASAFGDAATRLPAGCEGWLEQLVEEAGWARDIILQKKMNYRWAAWRAERGL